jgi:murein DD-endopeptidase MepM/ murein hydrolase activator NlpD
VVIYEGIDWVHDDAAVVEVDVAVAADGEVVYVRTGCPESGTFSRNTSLRECGSGWGNHVVVHHGGQTYTRYAHLADGQVLVEVGDELSRGDVLGVMGNSGRSEVRHLHFELGAMSDPIDPCAPAFSFATVHDPAGVGL